MILYKITNQYDKTRNNTQWGVNITHTASGEGELCGPGFIHAYASPHHAVLFNLIFRNFNEKNMHIWMCMGNVVKNDGIKIGCTKLTTIKKVEIPEITIKQKIYFGYLCAKDTLHIFEKEFPDEKRPQHALEMVKKYLYGKKINEKIINTFSKNILNAVNFIITDVASRNIDTINIANAIDVIDGIANLIIFISDTINNFIDPHVNRFGYAIIGNIYIINNMSDKNSTIDNNIKKMINFK